MVYWSRLKDIEFSLQKITNIFSFFVSSPFRGIHYGSRLLDFIIDDSNKQLYDEITLEVRSTNKSAIRLYSSRGFIEQQTEENYYDYGNTPLDMCAIEMVRSLNILRS